MELHSPIREALTFDDVLLLPGKSSSGQLRRIQTRGHVHVMEE